MIQGAVFDFDGTLFDSMHLWQTLGENYLRSLGKEPRPDLQTEVSDMSMERAVLYFQTEYDIPLSAQEIISGINRIIEDQYFYNIQPKSGVKDFLEKLKNQNVNMCIATANDRYLVEAALKRCDMIRFFRKIFTSSETGRGKDRPDIFRKARKCLKTDNVIVFEDAYYAAKTAKEDGFRVVGVYDKYEKKTGKLKDLADFYLEDFNDTESFWEFASEL